MPFYYHLQDFQEYFINSITESYALTFWQMHFIVKTAEVVQNVPYLPFTVTAKPSGLTFLPWVRKRTVQHSCLKNPMDRGAWKATVHGVTEGRTQLSDFTFTFHIHALEEEMATHSSVLAWRIPGTGEPGGLPSLGSHRVGHDWSDRSSSSSSREA